MGRGLAVAGLVSAGACQRPDDDCVAWSAPTEVGTLPDDLVEASGIAASARHEGLWWVHQDSSAAPLLWLLEDDGAVRGTFALAGASAVDWEDIAVREGVLYVADTGDNDGVRTEVVVYEVPEPTSLADGPYSATLDGVTAHHLTLPHGPVDIETLVVDGTYLGLVTRAVDGKVGVYRARRGIDGPVDELATLDLGLDPTGGDLSHDGRELVLRDADEAWVWAVTDLDWPTALESHEPCPLELPQEQQGEGIGYALGDKSLRTVSEGGGSAVHELRRD